MFTFIYSPSFAWRRNMSSITEDEKMIMKSGEKKDKEEISKEQIKTEKKEEEEEEEEVHLAASLRLKGASAKLEYTPPLPP